MEIRETILCMISSATDYQSNADHPLQGFGLRSTFTNSIEKNITFLD